jgi:hypothetical protein
LLFDEDVPSEDDDEDEDDGVEPDVEAGSDAAFFGRLSVL